MDKHAQLSVDRSTVVVDDDAAVRQHSRGGTHATWFFDSFATARNREAECAGDDERNQVANILRVAIVVQHT
jgi:hypothetical protein